MLFISKQGHVDAERVIVKIFPAIENGPMEKVNGIVVHQTGGSTANSAFESYRTPGANGAHFLIDRDGKVYQTASLFKVTAHVGILKSRCLVERKCSPTEIKKVTKMKIIPRSSYEIRKTWPNRYPWNTDSIGIEIVGMYDKNKIYEPVNQKQGESLKWLIGELIETLGVSMSEIYRHPDLSHKNQTEASTAQW
ncbi:MULTISPECIES: peptidoglycan recognition protein family protein [Cupriavidus]